MPPIEGTICKENRILAIRKVSCQEVSRGYDLTFLVGCLMAPPEKMGPGEAPSHF